MLDEGLLFPREDRVRLTKYGWNKIRGLIFERDEELCVTCKRRGGDVHHVRTRGAYGGDVIENLVLLCHECHMTKAHGIEAAKWKGYLKAYLQSECIKAWNEAHRKQAEEIYKKYRR